MQLSVKVAHALKVLQRVKRAEVGGMDMMYGHKVLCLTHPVQFRKGGLRTALFALVDTTICQRCQKAKARRQLSTGPRWLHP
ncbi:hypothetical protein CYG48_01655 [Neorhizobium sp. SOG26]|nr:hypothetical protein CYG48_01655 [Neorhizobium sp. SOG26]